jgi:hypothetical protein
MKHFCNKNKRRYESDMLPCATVTCEYKRCNARMAAGHPVNLPSTIEEVAGHNGIQVWNPEEP